MIQLKDLAPTDQVRLSAAVFHLQERERATRAAVERALRTPEVQALVRSLNARKQAPVRPRVASHPSIIQRSAPDLRQMQADLARMTAQGAKVERQVRRERAGIR